MATKTEKWTVVGQATIETQVGAGRARVDLPVGSYLPGDVSDEDRKALEARGAIRRENTEPDIDSVPAFDGAAVVRPVPGIVEPDEIPRDLIPGGTIDAIMGWVGDDLARARVARDAELAKGPTARAGLLKRLDTVKAEQETEPPVVPEAINPDIPGGRVDAPAITQPVDQAADPAATSKTASKTTK